MCLKRTTFATVECILRNENSRHVRPRIVRKELCFIDLTDMEKKTTTAPFERVKTH